MRHARWTVSFVPLAIATGSSAGGCTGATLEDLEALAIEPGGCTVVAKDVATGAIRVEDGPGGGFFRAKATPKGAAAADRRA